MSQEGWWNVIVVTLGGQKVEVVTVPPFKARDPSRVSFDDVQGPFINTRALEMKKKKCK